MAYLKPLPRPRCGASACPKRATVKLLGNRNEDLGEFCARHGAQALKARQQLEGGTVASARRRDRALHDPLRGLR